jgi:hypothetical protein
MHDKHIKLATDELKTVQCTHQQTGVESMSPLIGFTKIAFTYLRGQALCHQTETGQED